MAKDINEIKLKALNKAISCFHSQGEMSRQLGVKPQTITKWLSTGKGAPLKFAGKIEKVTKGKVTKEMLAPEIYNPEYMPK